VPLTLAAEVQPVPDLTTPTIVPTTAATSFEVSPLSPAELYQLTLYKWRYSLEAFGFAHAEVRELMFLKWLYATRRLLP
jgi:hypothetical protein